MTAAPKCHYLSILNEATVRVEFVLHIFTIPLTSTNHVSRSKCNGIEVHIRRVITGPDSSVGFDPGPRHTKVVKNGTSCSSLGTQTYGVELGLVDPVSG